MVIVEDILEVQPPRFNKSRFTQGLAEIQNCIEGISADGLISWYRANGRESDKSVSKAVNALILQNLEEAGWELNWSFCPAVNSNHATFEASKDFNPSGGLRFAMDVGSRHSNEALGYLVKGQLAKKRMSDSSLRQVDAHVLLAFTQQCLDWGKWNGAVYPYEKLISNVPLVKNSVNTPLWIIAIGEPRDLKISYSLAKTLKLEKLET